uniref:ATP-dependent Clp protease proteolytic subunit n=1 Tax=Paulinella chromatophora TaxID=39717 RepID=B1X3L4_PAUCH|nr:ATP-dependent Clp protease proteolytic subunit [Paulinella chromatophora]ACB42533.1 ATP-dependent Clp protease proteolytic subunit [Paulinella chromatophora]
MQRTLFVAGDIDDTMANDLVAALLYMNAVSTKIPICINIDSRGGSITSAFTIYDTINYISAPVKTVCLSVAESMAVFLLAAGEKGQRFALPNSRIIMEQPIGNVDYRQASDLLIETIEMGFTKRRINECMAEMTGQPMTKIEQDTSRRYHMSAAESVKYGLIDHVLTIPPRSLTIDPDLNPLLEPNAEKILFL